MFFLHTLIVLGSFFFIEFVAWFTHKYVMHGFLWTLHKDHHYSHKGFFEDDVPDHSVVSRFRKALTQSGAWDVLLEQINKQLIQHGVLLKQGAIIDASMTERPRKPTGKSRYTLTGDQEVPIEKELPARVDKEASWVKKNGKLLYGYKRHYLSDSKEGLVLSVHTTAAHAHESKHLHSCLAKVSLQEASRVLADK